nr:ExeM/NucH family extracellular endonuclease [Tahibacter caeni]
MSSSALPRLLGAWLLTSLLSCLPSLALAQCVSLTTLGSASTQNFDTLSNTAGSTTNNLTIPGWFMTESGGGARDNEQYAVDTGASTTGDTYSYGAAGSTERALGELRSGTLIPLFGACFTNNTGSTVTSLAVAFTGEEWRLGTINRTDQLNFEYSTNATDLVTGTWTNVAALSFVTPDTVTAGAKNGNAAGERTALSSTISSLSIANGATFWIRWNDVDASGADDGLAVDDFSLTPQGTIPNNLSINDVTLNEGNAGTTSFTFTVSLSAPAGPGGVTFDIATADGTAAAPGDYTAKSLTGQTIPAGSSTYSFTVLVNGDTAPETNETFFVNVTNVTGATVTDGQGQGTVVNDDAAPNLTINDVALNEGNAGTTTFTFTVSLSAPAPTGGVTFDIATANDTATAPGDYAATSLTGQTIPAGSSTYAFDVPVNGDTTPEADETFFVNVTNATNAIVTDGQGRGTIVNDDLSKIHDVQGNGAATPIPGASVMVEGIVVGNYQGASRLRGFFLQEEDADADADPNTSEGVFVFCSACPTPVAEGQRVRVSGTVSEFNNLTEITASTAPSVVVTGAGNNLAQVTPTPIDLPVAGGIDAFYEARESMRVTFVDTLTVSDSFELGHYGQVTLSEGGRPRSFTEFSAPSVAGYAAYQDTLARRRVLLDDENNAETPYLALSDGFQAAYHPQANGGFSVGTQGVDFFRGGDLVNGLTGVLDFASPDGVAAASWRLRPAAATPVTFTVANPRPATPPIVGGAIRVAGANLQNYFTTIDTTPSTSSGPCGPGGTLDCRGADSVTELNRQRERASIVACTLDADIVSLIELENTTPSATITDLLGAINARCGGAHPYAFVNTGGTLGTDAVRVQQIYRTGVVSPVGAPLSDLDPVHNRPPTAQTYDVVDATNAAFGQRFTVIANHLRAKSCGGASGADADAGDGQACFNATRTAQANRLLSWISSTVLPAAGDPDVLLLGDFNAYANEDPIAAVLGGGYADLETTFQGANAYSYVFGGTVGHLDYAFASSSLAGQVIGAAAWHINADEAPLLDYNDEVADTGEAAAEEKPDGSALVPPRVVFQPASPYRAADHDPVLVGLFAIADLAITVTDAPDPVVAGTNLTHTITVSNTGPDPAANASWNFVLPAGLSFVSLSPPAGWSCTTPAVGAGGTINCSNPGVAVGSSVFTLVTSVAPDVAAGTVLSATVTASSASGDPVPANNSATATTTVTAAADLGVTNTAAPPSAVAGQAITYTVTVANAGPSNAASVSLSNAIPTNTTFASLASPAGWSCTTPAVGATGTVNCTTASLAATSAVFTLVVDVNPGATAATISSTATVSSSTTDPNTGNESATATTPLTASADLGITSSAPSSVAAGQTLSYTITVTNAGPSNASNATVAGAIPASTTFASVSVSGAGGWFCTTPPIGSTGNVSCLNADLGPGSSTITLVVTVDPATTAATITGTVNVSSATADPAPGNDSATATTNVTTAADLTVGNTASAASVINGQPITYTLVVNNLGPSAAASVSLTNAIPANTTFTALTSPAGWSCTTPAVGATGTVSCSIASLPPGTATFSLTVTVDASAPVTVISDTATVTSATADPLPGNEAATATTSTPVSLQSFQVD